MSNTNKPHSYVCTVGKTFGSWHVIDDSHRKFGKVHCLCVCVCGTKRIVAVQTLRNGTSASCGCQHHGKPLEMHGMSDSLTYKNWRSMTQRCHNPKNVGYPWYGAKGVKVCERWRKSFTAFLSDMGERPPHASTVDRIDNKKAYGPGNCRWATQQEQTQNQYHPPGDLSRRKRDRKTGRLLPG